MRVLVTGGTGFIGRAIVDALIARGHDVVVSSRSADRVRKTFGDRAAAMEWDPMAGPPDLDGVEGVIHLAGENIGKGRWTGRKKKRLYDSRITGTRNLVAAEHKPKVLVSTSAIGFYGPTAHNIAHEGSVGAQGDFLADLCRDWEAEAIAARQQGVRVPIVRNGIVLGREGGAYPPQRRIFKLGLGGPIGLGHAWLSWVHLDDVVAIYLKCLEDEDMRGIYNATAPNPVSNGEFTSELGKAVSRPAVFPVPPPALRVVLGEFGRYVVMSQRVRPLRTIAAGYEFKYPTIRSALQALEGSGS